MYSFIKKPINKNALNELRIRQMNHLMAKNAAAKKRKEEEMERQLAFEKQKQKELEQKAKRIREEEEIQRQKEQQTNNNEFEFNIIDMVDVPPDSQQPNQQQQQKEDENNQLLVLKSNILALLRLSCISNNTCKLILDELNKDVSESKNDDTVVQDIWTCVNGIADAVTENDKTENDKKKTKKFSIDKTKIEKIKEEEKQENKSQLINYKDEMISKVDSIFTKAVNNLSDDVSTDIIQYTNVIIEHTRKSLHERLDAYLNSFLDGLFGGNK